MRGDHLREVLIQDFNWENFGVLERWSFMEDGCYYERWGHMEVHSTPCLSQYNVLLLDRGKV